MSRTSLFVLSALSIASLSLLVGCGAYSASSGRIDANLRRVTVPYLENYTAEPDIEIELTDLIIRALQDDRTLKVVDRDDADTELAGKVLHYRLKEAYTNPELLVDEYQLQILVELTMTEISSGEAVFAKKRIRGTGNFIVDDPEGTSEETARAEAAAEIIKQVLASVVEDW